MCRRRLLLFAPPTALLLLGIGVWALWPRTAITRENAAKVQAGMTCAEVEQILGGPARDDSTGPVAPDNQAPDNDTEFVLRPLVIDLAFGAGTPRPREWRSDETVVLVQFDADGHVTMWHYFDTRPTHRHPLALLRRWLRL